MEVLSWFHPGRGASGSTNVSVNTLSDMIAGITASWLWTHNLEGSDGFCLTYHTTLLQTHTRPFIHAVRHRSSALIWRDFHPSSTCRSSGWWEAHTERYDPPRRPCIKVENKYFSVLLFPLIKLCCMRGSVYRLNSKTALDTEALSCSSRWQNDEQLALQKNTRPIQRQITHRGRCARAMYNEWTSKGDEKQSEHWTLGFKTWPWRPVKSNSREHLHAQCNLSLIRRFYGLVFQRLWITYIAAELKAK